MSGAIFGRDCDTEARRLNGLWPGITGLRRRRCWRHAIEGQSVTISLRAGLNGQFHGQLRTDGIVSVCDCIS